MVDIKKFADKDLYGLLDVEFNSTEQQVTTAKIQNSNCSSRALRNKQTFHLFSSRFEKRTGKRR